MQRWGARKKQNRRRPQEGENSIVVLAYFSSQLNLNTQSTLPHLCTHSQEKKTTTKTTTLFIPLEGVPIILEGFIDYPGLPVSWSRQKEKFSLNVF